MRKNGFRLTRQALNRLVDFIQTKYGDMPSYRLAEQVALSKDTLRRIFQQDESSPTVSVDTLRRFAASVDFPLREADYEYAGATQSSIDNPFVWRQCIHDPDAFFGRKDELGRLRSYLLGRTNCHVRGAARIGKSSLLRHLRYRIEADDWLKHPVMAFLDMTDARLHSPRGIWNGIAAAFGWKGPADDEIQFNDLFDRNYAEERNYIISFDNFELYRDRPHDGMDRSEERLWNNMRFISGRGVSIITASFETVREIVPETHDVSPFFNTFAILELPPFSVEEAIGFVRLKRDGVPSFTSSEAEAIVGQSRRHPLALQILCYYVLQEKIENSSRSLSDVLQEAEAEIRRQIKDWAEYEEEKR